MQEFQEKRPANYQTFFFSPNYNFDVWTGAVTGVLAGICNAASKPIRFRLEKYVTYYLTSVIQNGIQKYLTKPKENIYYRKYFILWIGQ